MVYGCWLNGGYGIMVFGMILGLIVIIAIIWLVIWLIKKGDLNFLDKRSPSEILKERYAKGEINKKQYEQMKKEVKK